MYRTKDFDEYLSEEMKTPEFRREYLLALMEDMDEVEGLPLFEALKMVIAKMGVTEFAELVGMKRSSVSRILSQASLPRLETLDKFLEPFGLKVKIEVA